MAKAYNYLILLWIVIATSCFNNEKKELIAGVWRATLKTQAGVEIPFNFEVKNSVGKKIIKLINGSERFLIDDISTQNDTIIIKINLFDSEIRAVLKGSSLSGNWIKHLANKDVIMEFNAVSDTKWRFFKTSPSSKFNISGKWSALFKNEQTHDTTIAIGSFSQKGTYLAGTFLTPTGDYRFLEGTVYDKIIYLSAFDGSNAVLFTGKLKNDSTIIDGMYYSGFSSIKSWQARKDDKAILPDAFSLTTLKPGLKKIKFSFKDLNNKNVSDSDDKFKNKVVIVQFLGSWCPNCMDETAYLSSSFYNKFNKQGVEIIGLAYERTTDPVKSKKALLNLKNRFDIKYDILLTGFSNDTREVVKSIPELKSFSAFPTTIIIDKKGVVRQIHTGFTGPGTGMFYEKFITEFEKTVSNLLAEK